MTLKQNSFEGHANGAALTISSTTSSGDQVGVASTGTPTLTYTTAQSAHGSVCASITATASADSGGVYFYGTGGSVVGRAYVRFSAVPSATTEIVSIYGSGGGEIGRVFVNSDGTVRLDDAAGAAVFTSTTALAANTWYRVETALAVGASITTGTLKMSMYALDSTTVLGDITYSSTARNCGAAGSTVSNIQWGKPSNSAWLGTTYVDDIASNDGTTTFIGPAAAPPANVIPTVTAGATVTMTSGTTANISATGNDTDGTVSSFAATLASTSSTTTPTIGTPVTTGAGTANASTSIPISNLTPGDHKFNVTDTDNLGAVSTPAVCRIVYTSLNPTRRSVTLNGVTMTAPTSGAPVDALNNQATVPVSFTTAGPPAAGAGVVEAFQPLDSASVAPNFGQYWAASDTVTPITIYVDLKFNGATVATATATLTGTTPVLVGRTCTAAENTAIGADRSTPVVASRFS